MPTCGAPTLFPVVGLLCRGGPFLLVTFDRRESSRTLGQQRKVTRPALDGRKLWLCCHGHAKEESVKSPWIPAFAGMTSQGQEQMASDSRRNDGQELGRRC